MEDQIKVTHIHDRLSAARCFGHDTRRPEALLQTYFIGTAGWGIPKQHAGVFVGSGSHLERYGRRLPVVEINSSFYRSHRLATYARWANSVSPGFRFSVKVPREITHTLRLVDAVEPLEGFLAEVKALGSALGPLLVQIPPGLRFAAAVTERFLSDFRERFNGQLACEPRHKTWFDDAADALFTKYHVARVAADPAIVPRAALPGGWPGLVYIRLHGSPKMYYSAYTTEQVEVIADRLCESSPAASDHWCIFDNTALGEATGQALDLKLRLDSRRPVVV